MRIRYSCSHVDSKSPGAPTDYKKIRCPRPALLRFSTAVTWLYSLQSIFETENYSREKICWNCRLSLPNYVLYFHRLDQVHRSPVPVRCLEEVTPYLPSKEPVLNYAGSVDHLNCLSMKFHVKHLQAKAHWALKHSRQYRSMVSNSYWWNIVRMHPFEGGSLCYWLVEIFSTMIVSVVKRWACQIVSYFYLVVCGSIHSCLQTADVTSIIQ